jgi:hypothetical protein
MKIITFEEILRHNFNGSIRATALSGGTDI